MQQLKRIWLICVLLFISSAFPYEFSPSASYSHEILTIGTNGSCIELEDGSIWNVKPSSQSVAAAWSVGDKLVISPNHRLIGPHFDFTNLRVGNYVSVSFSIAPKIYSSRTFEVVECDVDSGVVKIANGEKEELFYVVEAKDRSYLAEWEPGNAVIIGSNEWYFARFFSNSESILLNSECNHFVRASKL